jgi:lipopolysaccharide biosynthesis glycosyltransferase
MTNTRSVHACTIIAKNYIAFARTLCDSFLAHHPHGVFYTLVIDDIDGYIDPSKEHFEILSIASLSIPNLRDFCFKYHITELSTAVKPYVLKYLFDVKQVDKLLYLDPDILVTSSLDDLYHRLDVHDIVLTPHLDTDFPDDGHKPDDAQVMLSGIFNLGFIGLRKNENTDRFLKWWQHKLYSKCIADQGTGYFVDQKFIDYALVLFQNISIVHDTAYNVAYWNLHSRIVTYRDGHWMCNDRRLAFYHFSNYKPERPHSISGYQTRFELSRLPNLHRLFSFYHDLLIKNGYEESRKWPYSYSEFETLPELFQVLTRSYRGYAKKVNLETFFSFSQYREYLRVLRLRLSMSVKQLLNWKRK